MTFEYINYEQVKNGAQEISSCADVMQDIFDQVTGSMRNMTSEENFGGRASDALKAEFEPFKGQFINYVNTVKRFAALYGSATETLQANEEILNKQIQQL